MPAHDDRHPPRRLRKNRSGARDPAIRDGGLACGHVKWACDCFEITVEREGDELRLVAWQVDAMPDKSERWTCVYTYWTAKAPEEAI